MSRATELVSGLFWCPGDYFVCSFVRLSPPSTNKCANPCAFPWSCYNALDNSATMGPDTEDGAGVGRPHDCPLPQECRLNRPSSAAQLQTRIESTLAGRPCLGHNKLSREPSFVVVHFAGPVRYHTAGLVEKNKVSLGHSI